jgi:membrane protease YdiL (CAAX protease family)
LKYTRTPFAMKHNKFTYLGLFISYFSIVLIGMLLKAIHGGPLDDLWTVVREVITFMAVGLLFWIIIKKEHLSLDSIGITQKPWKQTALWTVIIFLFCLIGAVASLGIIKASGSEFGKSAPKVKLSLLTTTLVMLRAGIAEEVFFRGYILERLQVMLRSRWAAILLSVIPFALLHYSQGVPGIFISFIMGSILTATYLWKRNLKANMIAHFLVDFIPNVLFPLFS